MLLPILATIWMYMTLQYLIIGLVIIPTLTQLLCLLYSLVNVNLTTILVLNYNRSQYVLFLYQLVLGIGVVLLETVVEAVHDICFYFVLLRVWDVTQDEADPCGVSKSA